MTIVPPKDDLEHLFRQALKESSFVARPSPRLGVPATALHVRVASTDHARRAPLRNGALNPEGQATCSISSVGPSSTCWLGCYLGPPSSLHTELLLVGRAEAVLLPLLIVRTSTI